MNGASDGMLPVSRWLSGRGGGVSAVGLWEGRCVGPWTDLARHYCGILGFIEDILLAFTWVGRKVQGSRGHIMSV